MPFDKIGNRYQLYLGTMAENTVNKNQRWFHVFCPELMPFIEGDVTRDSILETIEMYNVLTNQHEKTEINTTTTIFAEYLGTDTSKSVPTMWRGQQVYVVNFANSDKFYWVPLERDDSIRRREHLRWSCANQDITNKELTDDNTYFMEIDTKYRKHFWIHMAPSDGEKFGYDFKIDAEAHTVELYDTPKEGGPTNTIRIDSDIPRISLQNSVGTSILLNNVNLEINVPGDMILNVSKDVRINVKRNWFINIIGNVRDIITGIRTTTQIGPWIRNIVGHQIHSIFGTRTTTLQTDDIRTVVGHKIDTLGDDTVTIKGPMDPTMSQATGPPLRTYTNLGDDTTTILGNKTTIVSKSYLVNSETYTQFAKIGKIGFTVFNSKLTIVIPSPVGQATCQLVTIN